MTGLEQIVDDLFERSDKRVFEIFHKIANAALFLTLNEGPSQEPSVKSSDEVE